MKFFGWLFLATTPTGILASSTGASACPRGRAAVGGAHVTTAKTLTNGTLSDGGFRVMIDKMTLDTDSMARLRPGETYNIQIMGAEFKGFLIRADKNANGDPVIFTEDSNFVRIANICTNDDVAGITHTFNSIKTSIMGSINVPEDGVYPVDVTVVVSNSGGVSEYYYTAYNITTDPNADLPSDDDGTEEGDRTVDDTSAAFDGLSLLLGGLFMTFRSGWMIFM